MMQYVIYQKTQSTDIGNSLNFEDEEFDFFFGEGGIHFTHFPLSELNKKP